MNENINYFVDFGAIDDLTKCQGFFVKIKLYYFSKHCIVYVNCLSILL